jgi:hypothetical protein
MERAVGISIVPYVKNQWSVVWGSRNGYFNLRNEKFSNDLMSNVLHAQKLNLGLDWWVLI